MFAEFGGHFLAVPHQSLSKVVWFWLRRSAALQVKEERGGGREGQTPDRGHWAAEGLAVGSRRQTEISSGVQNALEGAFVRFQG